jgi:hypothetical protein
MHNIGAPHRPFSHPLVVGQLQSGHEANAFRERGATDGRWHCIRRTNPTTTREVNADTTDFPKWGNRSWPAMVAAKVSAPELDQLTLRWMEKPPVEGFYDLSADPYCNRDLLDETAHAAQLARMRTTLDEWILRTGDNAMRRKSWADRGTPHRERRADSGPHRIRR